METNNKCNACQFLEPRPDLNNLIVMDKFVMIFSCFIDGKRVKDFVGLNDSCKNFKGKYTEDYFDAIEFD